MKPDLDVKRNYFQDTLESFRAQDLYRELRVLEPLNGVKAMLQEREITIFCSNDYLGLSTDKRVISACQNAAEHYGIGAKASRLVSGTWDVHQELEAKIAALRGKEAALVFSAGYLANVGTLSAVAGPRDAIILDKLCHASLIDGAKLSGATLRVFPHKNYDRCEDLLKNAKKFEKRILVSDAVFSMDGDLADFRKLIALKEQYDCLLILDDAHGTGVLGLHGGGALEDAKLESGADIVTGTLSKALGALGGFAACSASLKDYLINTSRSFIFATALPAPLCAAALESIRLMQEEPEIRQRLWQNIQRLNEGLKAAGFDSGDIVSPIFPLILGSEKKAIEASRYLLQKGFLIPAIRYPTVSKGKARLRITVSAAHSRENIDDLLNSLRRLPQELKNFR